MIRKITESRWIGPALAVFGILLMILGICRGVESGREAELSFYADVYDQRCEERERYLVRE